MPIDPETIQRIRLLADKPVATLTLREVLTISDFMDQDPTPEELAAAGLPGKLDRS